MDFDNYDNNYEMKERERLQDEQEQEQERERERLQDEREQEQETNFDEFEDVVVHLENLEQQQVEVNMNLGGRDDIPNVNKDIAGIKRSITNDVKKVFKDIFNVTIEKKNGVNSESILENTRFQNAKDGRFTIEFKGKRIGWIERDRSVPGGRDRVVSLFEKKNRKLVDEFKNSMDGAAREYQQTPESLVKNLPDYVVKDILNASAETLVDEIDQITATLTEQELREFAGVLNPKGPTAEVRIKALEVQADHWKAERQEAEKDLRGSPKELERARSEITKLESLEKTARLQADFERLKNNEKPVHKKTLDIINNEVRENDLSRLERFKTVGKRKPNRIFSYRDIHSRHYYHCSYSWKESRKRYCKGCW